MRTSGRCSTARCSARWSRISVHSSRPGESGTLPDEVREFADLVCGKELGSYSMFAGHIPDAVAVGVRPQAVEAIWQGNDTLLTEDEGRLADLCPGDDRWKSLRRRLFGHTGPLRRSGGDGADGLHHLPLYDRQTYGCGRDRLALIRRQ